MQTRLSETLLNISEKTEADSILRSCVHCGFCNATCPTYQLLGDELDGPRGRIYLIKQVLEGERATDTTQLHIDRCLQCRACETTCPSGVRYSRLMEIGRSVVERQQPYEWRTQLFRWGLRRLLPHSSRFKAVLNVGRFFAPLLPKRMRTCLPIKRASGTWPVNKHARTMLILDGCVQKVAVPRTNAATARVFDRLGISLEQPRGQGCCGALSYHLNAHEEGLDYARQNIDAWWPWIENGVEALIVTASGCGLMIKEYGDLLSHDTRYAEKAAYISSITRDLAEILAAEDLNGLTKSNGESVAFHAPCTLQHGQKLQGSVEGILESLGYQLTPVSDSHLCCGSAGTYSLLQPELAKKLRLNKLRTLCADEPDTIVSANIGCQLYLQQISHMPINHWIELLDPERQH